MSFLGGCPQAFGVKVSMWWVSRWFALGMMWRKSLSFAPPTIIIIIISGIINFNRRQRIVEFSDFSCPHNAKLPGKQSLWAFVIPNEMRTRGWKCFWESSEGYCPLRNYVLPLQTVLLTEFFFCVTFNRSPLRISLKIYVPSKINTSSVRICTRI